MKIRITRQFDDYDPVVLGHVEAEGVLESEVETFIKSAWEKFQAEHPDSDSEFIEYLVAYCKCKKLEDEFSNAYVG